jgi:excinuclease UvrABC ATPase subunit
MWLAAGQTPDFRTINRFHSERLKPLMDRLFTELTKLLIKEGYIDGQHYFLDGTKIEANANKYSFVWKKSVQGYEEKLQAKVEDLLEEIHEQIQIDTSELRKEDPLFQQQRLSSEAFEGVIQALEEELQQKEAKFEEIQDVEKQKETKQEIRSLKKAHKRDFKIYECESCEGSPFKSDCTKAKANRQVHYNPVYEE